MTDVGELLELYVDLVSVGRRFWCLWYGRRHEGGDEFDTEKYGIMGVCNVVATQTSRAARENILPEAGKNFVGGK